MNSCTDDKLGMTKADALAEYVVWATINSLMELNLNGAPKNDEQLLQLFEETLPNDPVLAKLKERLVQFYLASDGNHEELQAQFVKDVNKLTRVFHASIGFNVPNN